MCCGYILGKLKIRQETLRVRVCMCARVCAQNSFLFLPAAHGKCQKVKVLSCCVGVSPGVSWVSFPPHGAAGQVASLRERLVLCLSRAFTFLTQPLSDILFSV